MPSDIRSRLVDQSDIAGISLMLRALRGGRFQTRQQLGELTLLSRSQINQRLGLLRAAGLIEELSTSESTGGRPARALSITRGRGYVLSAALGIEGLVIAAVDLSGDLIDERRADVQIALGPHKVLDSCLELSRELMATANLNAPWGVGISVPGPVDHDRGTVSSPPVMPGWNRFPIQQWLQDRLSSPCWIDNDANAIAVGEHRYGTGRGHDDLIAVEIGAGIGSGIIMGDALQRGDKGCAGDIGHLPVRDSQVPCRCGNIGCLEAVAGGMALTELANQLIHDGQSAILTEISAGLPATAADLTRAAEFGDTLCLGLVQQAGARIGAVLANVVSILNPSKVIIGGSLSNSEALFTAIRKSLYAQALPLASRDLLLQRSSLGDVAGVLGTAELVLDQLFSPLVFSQWLAIEKS